MSCTLPDPITTDVAVIGGGIVGLGIAWEAQRTGHRVVVIDPAPGTGATFAAAGMLAPVSELHYQEEDLLELTLASAERWPGFRRVPARRVPRRNRVAQHADAGAGCRPRGPAGACRPVRGPATARPGGHPAEHPGSPGARTHAGPEPCRGLPGSTRTTRSIRARWPAAIAARPGRGRRRQGRTRDAGRTLVRANAVSLLHEDPDNTHSRVTGRAAGGRTRGPCAGSRRGQRARRRTTSAGLPEGLRLPLRPVYGDILRLRVPENLRPLTTATLRGLVRGLPVYVVPRSDGTVVIGATSREDGSAGVSAGGVHQLLRDAQVLLPAVAELELLETTARARPGTPDNAPLLGRVAGAGGNRHPRAHHRHRVLPARRAADPHCRPHHHRAVGRQERPRLGIASAPTASHPPFTPGDFMSTIQLNGTTRPLAAGTPCAELVAALTGRTLLPTGHPADGGRLGVAVALQLGHRPAQPVGLHRARAQR